MLIPEQAVDRESGLISDAESSLAEHVQALGLRGQEDLPESLVPRFQPCDLVDNDLTFDGHAEAVGPRQSGAGLRTHYT